MRRPADGDEAEADRLLEVGQLLNALDPANDKGALDIAEGLDVLDLEPDADERRVDLLYGQGGLAVGEIENVGQPGLWETHGSCCFRIGVGGRVRQCVRRRVRRAR